MNRESYLDAIRDESAELIEAAESAGMETPVPSCPEWTVAELLAHVGTVQRWAAGLVESRAAEPNWNRDTDHPSEPEALLEWVRQGSARLLDVLDSTPSDATMWTFTGPGKPEFWLRRQAHEISMHRVDAQLAADRVTPIDAELARDGIDEFLDVIIMLRLRDRLIGTGETLHFHCTDGDGEWLVRLTPEGPDVERAHAKGDVAVRGTASDLLMVIRNRGGLDRVEVFGNTELLALWHERSAM
jgi:uncharacterized protein (TIGR03083 family)